MKSIIHQLDKEVSVFLKRNRIRLFYMLMIMMIILLGGIFG